MNHRSCARTAASIIQHACFHYTNASGLASIHIAAHSYSDIYFRCVIIVARLRGKVLIKSEGKAGNVLEGYICRRITRYCDRLSRPLVLLLY